MKFSQEYIAENLHENLKRYFKENSESIQISIEGAGVHWHCNRFFPEVKRELKYINYSHSYSYKQ